MAVPTMLTFACVQCGKSTQREYRGSGGKPTLCSNACKIAAYRQRSPDRVKDGRDRERAKGPSSWVAERRIYKRWANRAKRQAIAAEVEPKRKRCRECGVVVHKHKQRCEPCRARAMAKATIRNRKSASARAAKAWRKAHQRGALGGERFDPVEVLERDKWRCHLCGIATPKRLRGTWKPNAPELDHIVPLSQGGLHTRANTACSCRSCNGAKGDSIKGQMAFDLAA